MTHYSLLRWEQDGAGGDHGTATYFPGSAQEVSVVLPTFKDAFNLYSSIAAALDHTRWDARRALLNEIGRIEP